MGDIFRLQLQINSMSLVIQGLEQRIAEIDGGYCVFEETP